MADAPKQTCRDHDLAGALKRVFGFHEFRPNQEEIVRAVLAGRDVFAVMPTGGGKSLCYQLPAHLLEGTCVVISPLISLMKDQVDAAKANGLRAEFLNSSLAAADRSRVARELTAGRLDLLYVAPERFTMEHFLSVLKSVRLSMFAVDEAHCISEWGHDFRPDYLQLSLIVEQFGAVPVAAFTATATARVQEDTIGKLGLRSPHVVRASFNRPNLFYQIVPKESLEEQVLAFVREHPDESGIVYRTTRRDVEGTAAYLAADGVRALPYHAGLADGVRKAHQEAFNRDEAEVIVATIAFGMGIDKSNVRFVVHGDLPKNIESYYQETGRAGRDGEPALCTLFFSRGDTSKIRYFIDQIEDDTQRRVALGKLNQMVQYGGVNACRRRRLLAYFGEDYTPDNCGACDICSGDVQKVEATTEAQIVMSAIARTQERYGAGHVVDVVVGADTQRIRDLGHDKIRTYGAGKHKDAPFWRRIVDDLLAQGCLAAVDERYPVLHLTPRGRDVLFGRRKFHVLRQREVPSGRKRRRARAMPAPSGPPGAELEPRAAGLHDRLRALRKRLAQEEGVPPFVVYSDRTLRELASRMPTNRGELRDITGIGEGKLRRYGRQLLAEIRDHLGARPAGQSEVPPVPRDEQHARDRRPPSHLSLTVLETWALAHEGSSYRDIAQRRGLTVSTIVKHLETLILAGREIDLDAQVPADNRRQVEALFKRFGTVSLSRVVQESAGTATFEEVRIVRAALTARDGA